MIPSHIDVPNIANEVIQLKMVDYKCQLLTMTMELFKDFFYEEFDGAVIPYYYHFYGLIYVIYSVSDYVITDCMHEI